MNGIWQPSPLDRGFPQIDLWKAAGCNRGYFLARYPTYENGQFVWHDNVQQLNNGFRSAVTGTGTQYAVARDPHWDGIQDYNVLAGLANQDIYDATAGVATRQCAYQFDIEWPYRDGAWLLALFKAFRKLRPGRKLSWTMEPLQGGWIKQYPALVDWINRDINMVLVVQAFFGDMSPVPWQQLRDDMAQTGISAKRVRIFYDAARARPVGWDGCLFHAERLVVAANAMHHENADASGLLRAAAEITQLDAWRRERYEQSLAA